VRADPPVVAPDLAISIACERTNYKGSPGTAGREGQSLRQAPCADRTRPPCDKYAPFRVASDRPILSAVAIYRLQDTTGDDLGLLEHPARNVEPGDVVMLADGREAIVTARVEAEPGWGQLVALL
jgi:hypothetical protein